jgi:hypothetical protein
MTLQDQIDELIRQQNASAVEGLLLYARVISYTPHGTPTAGINTTYHAFLDGSQEAFHKPFGGVMPMPARAYGHEPETVPLNECAAWRLARALGSLVEEIVAPCVLRSYKGEAGSLSARRYGPSQTREPFIHAPEQCSAAGFFDSLVAQQDRHLGNFRWDPGKQLLGLIDHGYAFALPGHFSNSSAFAQDRWNNGNEALTEWERASLEQLLATPDLHGLDGYLEPDRTDRLRERARTMLQTGQILPVGSF